MIIKRGDAQPILAVINEDIDFNEDEIKTVLANVKRNHNLKSSDLKKDNKKQ